MVRKNSPNPLDSTALRDIETLMDTAMKEMECWRYMGTVRYSVVYREVIYNKKLWVPSWG